MAPLYIIQITALLAVIFAFANFLVSLFALESSTSSKLLYWISIALLLMCVAVLSQVMNIPPSSYIYQP